MGGGHFAEQIGKKRAGGGGKGWVNGGGVEKFRGRQVGGWGRGGGVGGHDRWSGESGNKEGGAGGCGGTFAEILALNTRGGAFKTRHLAWTGGGIGRRERNEKGNRLPVVVLGLPVTQMSKGLGWGGGLRAAGEGKAQGMLEGSSTRGEGGSEKWVLLFGGFGGKGSKSGGFFMLLAMRGEMQNEGGIAGRGW